MTKIIVTRDIFKSVVESLSKTGIYDADCETTGLKWYDKDELFSITIGDGSNHFYFDFNWHPDHLGNMTPEESRLPREWIKELRTIFENPASLWFMHNAKFDMAMLAREGLAVHGTVHCTEAMARLLNPQFKSYTLSECVSRMNKALNIVAEEKSGSVMEYITANKLYVDVEVRGKEKAIREVWFHKVPFGIMVDYTLTDGVITNKLGHYQLKEIDKIMLKNPSFMHVVHNERQLTKTALDMALAGISFDQKHVEQNLDLELDNMRRAKEEWRGETGEDFVDHGNHFAKIFDARGIPYFKTEAGNPSFDEYNINKMNSSPLLDLILAHRGAAKLAGTYYSSFLYYGANGKIYADMRQGGTRTGRVSYREPNMQNIPKPDEETGDNEKSLQVRGCFKPEPDHCFFMPDYDQMEYRMMLDQAEEIKVIKAILEDNLDVHEATAKMMGVTRQQAKTLNFMLLYGGGVQKLADALGISFLSAKALKNKYFFALPHVKRWIWRTTKVADMQGSCVNWFGRIGTVDKGFAYKAPNQVIQGGTADVVKKAMNEIHLDMKKEGLKSKMILQIHDELLFQMHKSELDYCPRIVEIMQSIYPYKRLPLTAGPSYSWLSWGEKTEGYPLPQVAI